MFTKSTKNEWALIMKCGKERTFRYGLWFKVGERQNVTVALMWNKKNRCVSHYTSVTFTDKFKCRLLISYPVMQSWDYFAVMYCWHDASFPSETQTFLLLLYLQAWNCFCTWCYLDDVTLKRYFCCFLLSQAWCPSPVHVGCFFFFSFFEVEIFLCMQLYLHCSNLTA